MEIKTSLLDGDSLKWAALRAFGHRPSKRNDLLRENTLDMEASEAEQKASDAALDRLLATSSNDWVIPNKDSTGENAPLMSQAAGDGFALALADQKRISVQIKHDGFRLAGIYNLTDELEHIQVAHDYHTAVLRCFVDSRSGPTVEIPSELVTLSQLLSKDIWIGEPPKRFGRHCMEKYLAAAVLTKGGPAYIAWKGRSITAIAPSLAMLNGLAEDKDQFEELPEGLYLSLKPGIVEIVERSGLESAPTMPLSLSLPLPKALAVPTVVIKIEGGEVHCAASDVDGLTVVVHEVDRFSEQGYSTEATQAVFDKAALGFGGAPVVSLLNSVQQMKAATTYSFRAECPHDLQLFSDELEKNGIQALWKVVEMTPGFPDVSVEMPVDQTLDQLLRLMANIPDSHVMRETLRAVPLAENSLERSEIISGNDGYER